MSTYSVISCSELYEGRRCFQATLAVRLDVDRECHDLVGTDSLWSKSDLLERNRLQYFAPDPVKEKSLKEVIEGA